VEAKERRRAGVKIDPKANLPQGQSREQPHFICSSLESLKTPRIALRIIFSVNIASES